jgi:hypothetical protein
MENFIMQQSVGLETAMLEAVDLPLARPFAQIPQGIVLAKPNLPKHNHLYMALLVSVISGCIVIIIIDCMNQKRRKEIEKQQKAQY